MHSLALVKLEIFKVNIKNNLANNFIKLFKSFIKVSIFFNSKLNKNLQFYIIYHNPNNFTIKNKYP